MNDDATANKRTQKWPRMSVAPGGRIDVAWYDYRHGSQDTPADDVEFFLGDANDVYLASSEDGGRSFGENERMTRASIDRTRGTYNVQYFAEVPPALASGEDHAYVAWSDTRLGNDDNGAQDIFVARRWRWRRVDRPPGRWSSLREVLVALVGVRPAGRGRAPGPRGVVVHGRGSIVVTNVRSTPGAAPASRGGAMLTRGKARRVLRGGGHRARRRRRRRVRVHQPRHRRPRAPRGRRRQRRVGAAARDRGGAPVLRLRLGWDVDAPGARHRRRLPVRRGAGRLPPVAAAPVARALGAPSPPLIRNGLRRPGRYPSSKRSQRVPPGGSFRSPSLSSVVTSQ